MRLTGSSNSAHDTRDAMRNTDEMQAADWVVALALGLFTMAMLFVGMVANGGF